MSEEVKEVSEVEDIPLDENELKNSGTVEVGEHGEAAATMVPNERDKLGLFILPIALVLSLVCFILNVPHCFENSMGKTHYNVSNIIYTVLSGVFSLIIIYVIVKRRKRLMS